MQNVYFLILFAVIAGIFIPLQGVVNNKLAVVFDSPVLAALFSFLVGTISLFIYALVAGVPLNSLAQIKNAPPIALSGGVLGAFFVASTIFLIPRLGVAVTFGVVVAGQMLFSILIDHYGWFGIDVKPLSVARVIGTFLIIAGVVIVRKF